MLTVNIITAFPEFFHGSICSLLLKAQEKQLVLFNVIDIKNHGYGKWKKIDDTEYGGGAGMILRVDVVESAINSLNINGSSKFIIPSPRGKYYEQKDAMLLSSQYDNITILCNRYEGVDQRIIDYYKFEEVSIGNFILLGGETAAMAIIESTVRLLPNVLGNNNSLLSETNEELCDNDHYTKPLLWNDLQVPNILTSGDHLKIATWRQFNKKKHPSGKK